MKRRVLLTLGTGLAISVLTGFKPAVRTAVRGRSPDGLLLADLEPDGMAQTYRRYRLLIVGQRDDRTASAFAQAVVDVLGHFLPESRPKVLRAADSRRIGVLIGTHQQDIAIMTRESAEALYLAKPPFADIRNAQLRQIVSFGSRILICRTDFLARHSYLLARTLSQHQDLLPAPASVPDGAIPAHQGSHAYFSGGEMPQD